MKNKITNILQKYNIKGAFVSNPSKGVWTVEFGDSHAFAFNGNNVIAWINLSIHQTPTLRHTNDAFSEFEFYLKKMRFSYSNPNEYPQKLKSLFITNI